MKKTLYTPYGVDMATAMARGTATGVHGVGDFVSRLLRLPLTLVEVLYTWQRRAEERTRLRHLDDRLLRDMGLKRADTEREAAIPFWRAS